MKLIDEELSYMLTYKDIVDIIKIIDDASCHELQIELDDFKLKIVKGGPHGAVSPVASPVPAVNPPADTKSAAGKDAAPKTSEGAGVRESANTAVEEEISGVPVRSPLAGTFYRAPEPGAKPFVDIGTRVEKGQQVGIVEVMKLMNSIKAPEKGVIREIRVKNEQSVAMAQVLMVIDPA